MHGQITLFLFVLLPQPSQVANKNLQQPESKRVAFSEDLETLRSLANNQKISRKRRAAAIFRLFESYLKPGDNSKRFRSIFKEAKWIRESTIHRITIIDGWMPIEWGPNIYCMDLFPDECGRYRWFIYFSLTGGEDGYVYGRELEPAMDYLEGRACEGVRILDFALCEYIGDDMFPQIKHPSGGKKE